jgi:non-specific serine/threonine protein kinase
VARDSFVGRERELVEVKRALATTRLLTLTGAGGAGKTRLALEAAGDVAALYPDGTWLVELAPLSDATLLVQAFARVLGVREQPGRPLADALVGHLRTRNLLLVADNCEHLIEAVAAVADALLGACPHLSILATSREALHVTGEVVWPVRPLSVPEGDGLLRPEDLMGYEAVRLFVDRARQRLPAFSLTPENARPVSEVCRRLDGMPLAIELATARLTALPVEQLAEKLEDVLHLLTVGGRVAEPRQRTLRAALDWSYDPLNAEEKRLFQRLSVFVGGWTLPAAEAVGGGSEESRVSGVLDVLSRLVDKSLVTVQTRGMFRYGMLEPVRQYAQEKLEGSGEAEEARRGHARYFMTLAEEAETELLGSQPVPWLERLEAELGNLRAALSWALDRPAAERDAELGLRTATALARFWGVHAVSEGREWLEKGLARSGVSPTVRAAALNQAGWLALFQGEPKGAIAMLGESLDLSKRLGDGVGAAMALANLGFALAHGGAHERVAALREEAERLQRDLVDRRALARLLEFLTLAALDVHDYERALAYPKRALELYRELGDAQGEVVSLTALGMASLGAGDPESAAASFEENLRLLQSVKEKIGIAYCLLGLGGVAGEQSRAERAARLWGAAEALREATGISLSPLDRSLLRYEDRLAAARSLVDEGEWEEAWAQGRTMTPDRAVEYALDPSDLTPERPAESKPAGPLTRREEEVARLVARGLTNRQISSSLSISENTVANHVARILKKLTLSSRSQVAVWVTQGDRALRNRVRGEQGDGTVDSTS